ncbi:MAG: alpha-E domain-containing protein, partial [Burkholderiales bacterium]
SMQRGGSSKDTWVLSTGPVSAFSLLRRETRPQDLVRTGLNLSSRVVENLFWFGRHAERCDNTARLLRLALERVIEEAPAERERAWPGIAGLLRRSGILSEEEAAADEIALARVLRAAVVDEARPGLAGGLRQLLRVASQLRERLSLDNWRTLNHMTRRLARGRGRPMPLSDALAELDRDISAFMTLAGFVLDGMTRDHGWRFLSLGRRVERLQFLCGMLQQALAGPRDADLGWLLELADSSVTYRSRYMARPEWLPVLDLLVRDSANPRSIAFQLKGLHDFLGRITDTYGEGIEERLDASVMALDALDPGADLRHGSARLAALLEEWHAAAYRLSEQLGLRFFSHVGEVSRQTFAV